MTEFITYSEPKPRRGWIDYPTYRTLVVTSFGLKFHLALDENIIMLVSQCCAADLMASHRLVVCSKCSQAVVYEDIDIWPIRFDPDKDITAHTLQPWIEPLVDSLNCIVLCVAVADSLNAFRKGYVGVINEALFESQSGILI